MDSNKKETIMAARNLDDFNNKKHYVIDNHERIWENDWALWKKKCWTKTLFVICVKMDV